MKTGRRGRIKKTYLYYLVQIAIFILFGLYLFFNLLEFELTISIGNQMESLLNLGSMLLSIVLILTGFFLIPFLCVLKGKLVFDLPPVYIINRYFEPDFLELVHFINKSKTYKKYQVIRC